MVSEAQADKNNVVCPVCGKAFHLKPSKIENGARHYCSYACHKQAKKEYMKGEKNHQYGLRGPKNASWKGGVRISNHGYRLIYCEGHPFGENKTNYVLEHRLVAEQHLLTDDNSIMVNGKRYLSPEFIVHHKNGNRLDNRVENLEVMSLSDHQRMHATKQSEWMERNTRGQFIKANGTVMA